MIFRIGRYSITTQKASIELPHTARISCRVLGDLVPPAGGDNITPPFMGEEWYCLPPAGERGPSTPYN